MNLSLLTFAWICSHINTKSATKFIIHKKTFSWLEKVKANVFLNVFTLQFASSGSTAFTFSKLGT